MVWYKGIMPRDGSATRERILDCAERLVIENGFAATSVDEVIAASGSSKGAFFHHFATKLDLARSLVARYAAADIAHLHTALATARAATADPAQRVVEFVRVFEDTADELMAAQSSCLYVSVLTERQLARAGTSPYIVEAIVAWRKELSELLHEAMAQRSDRPPVDADALADHVFVTFEGAFILARSTEDRRHMGAQLTVLRQLLEVLLLPPG
jgi:TetR/AcrR family transcriptional repressor of nem operon